MKFSKRELINKGVTFVIPTVIIMLLILALTVFDAKLEGIIWSDIDGLTIIEKLLYVIIMCSLECAVIYNSFLKHTKYKMFFRNAVLIVLMMMPMMWNFITGQFVSGGERMFVLFQADSESLALTEIMWNDNNEQTEDKYGLHGIQTIFLPSLTLSLEKDQGITTSEFTNGYSNTIPGAFALVNTELTKKVMADVKTVAFSDGIDYTITELEEIDDIIVVYTDCGKLLNSETDGGIRYAVFKDSSGKMVNTEMKGIYISQIGIQGKVWRALAKVLPYVNMQIGILHLICAALAALVFSAISLAIAKKYNILMAVIFYITFWLSPWTASFAKNLYWVEFTWFIPVLIGLIASIYTDNKKIRIVSYIAMFLSVFVKSLCGYEYMSTILIASMMFLAVDLIKAFIAKDKEKSKLIFKTTFILSILAVAGFLVAFLMHAGIRGEGNIVEGFVSIWNRDVARRIFADPHSVDPVLYRSLEASILVVVRQYFRFTTELIYGIPGGLFRLLCIIPLGIFGYEILVEEKVDVEKIALYVLSFIATVSFFVLVKGHAYIHTHMNYVLWYFGYMQICAYIIADKIIKIGNKNKGR